VKRIAILSDIHGNVPALEAVLDDVAGQSVDEVLVGGDLVGRGPKGSRVVRRIRELGFPAIGGNHEDYMLDFRRGNVPGEWLESPEWSASRWMAAELDEDAVAYIEDLPFSVAREDLRLVHGTPRSNREGIGPWTADGDLDELLAAVDERVLVCAHTHRPLVRERAGGQRRLGGAPFQRRPPGPIRRPGEDLRGLRDLRLPRRGRCGWSSSTPRLSWYPSSTGRGCGRCRRRWSTSTPRRRPR